MFKINSKINFLFIGVLFLLNFSLGLATFALSQGLKDDINSEINEQTLDLNLNNSQNIKKEDKDSTTNNQIEFQSTIDENKTKEQLKIELENLNQEKRNLINSVAPPQPSLLSSRQNEQKPSFSINFSQNKNEVKGELEIITNFQDSVDGVELYLQKQASDNKFFVGNFSFDSFSKAGKIKINTENFPNGIYAVLLEIKKGGGVFKETADNFNINNPPKSLNPQNVLETIQKKIENLPVIHSEDSQVQITQITQDVKTKLNELKETAQQKESEIKKDVTSIKQNIEAKTQEVEKELKQKENIIEQKINQLVEKTVVPTPLALVQEKVQEVKNLIVDFDNDGLSNTDELRFGTDVFNPDSDNDGYLDGIEVQNNFDPLSPLPEQKISFESPKIAGQINEDKLKVEKIELVPETPKPLPPKAQTPKEEKPKIKLEGKAIPNSFVVIFIYSEPIIVTVKTDENGNWSYVLDKNLSDGHHEVYVALTDN